MPLLYAALAYSAGIIAGAYWWRAPIYWLAAIGTSGVGVAIFLGRRARLACVLGLLTLFLTGIFGVQVSGTPNDSGGEILHFATNDPVSVVAHVKGEGLVRDAGGGEQRESIQVETEQVESEKQILPIVAGMRLTIYSDPHTHENDATGPGTPLPVFTYGQRVRVIARMRPPRNFRNSGAFDYRGYLAEQGIEVLGSAKVSDVELLPGFFGNRVTLWRKRIRRSVLAKIHSLWTPPKAALIDAMVIGEASFIDRDTRVDFQRSGTYHVLVVSGMNLAILAFAIFWLLRRLRMGEAWASGLTVLLSFGYASLCEWGAPILRAAFMLSLYLGTRWLYRQRAGLNVIGGAMLGVLLLDPRALLGASFQLTFLAVLAIAGIGVPLLERSSQPYRQAIRGLDAVAYDLSFPPKLAQFRLDLRLLAHKLSQFLGIRIARLGVVGLTGLLLAAFEVVLVSALMQVVLALPMAYYFHRATTLGLPANLLVVPLTELLMPTAVAAITLSYVSAVLAAVPAWLAAIALEGITGTVRFLGGFRLADLRLPVPSMIAAGASAGAFVGAIVLARRKRVLAVVGLASLLFSTFWLTHTHPAVDRQAGTAEVTAIDVGEGDSILVISPSGKTLLIDGGGPLGPWASEFDYGEDVVSPYLWSRGIWRLDAIALTHAHSDHISGLHAVLANFHPAELWLGANPMTAQLKRLLQAAAEQKVKVLEHRQGDDFDFGGLRVRVLAPARDWQVSDEAQNDDSLVLHIAYRNSVVLLEGDAGKKIERRIALQHPKAGLLKVGHHGSITATTPIFVAAVQPQWAIISVGTWNPFHLPRAEVLNRLAKNHVKTYRTDLDGAVTFYMDGERIMPRTPIPR